jgi:hypothetical protein
MTREHVQLTLTEICADDADDSHICKETGGERKMCGRTAEHPLAFPERRLDRIERHRTYYQQ